MTRQINFNRIEMVLDYIEKHLSEPLSVEYLASQGCWSRWQFQRVFGNATGLSVAQYVRELRLSKAAERLVNSADRHIDIALHCGFGSEISFSRAFNQMFGCTPGEYRKKGIYSGVRTPIKVTKRIHQIYDFDPRFLQIRIETKPAFQVTGVNDSINGLLSDNPDFISKVPQIWYHLKQTANVETTENFSAIGVIDTSQVQNWNDSLTYWAGTELSAELESLPFPALDIPEQKYAVVPHRGAIGELHKTLNWVLHCWLPDSDFHGINGYELEVYGKNYDPFSPDAYMEYWFPITL